MRNPAENHQIAVRLIRPAPAARLMFIYRTVQLFVIDAALDLDDLNDNLRRNAKAIEILRAGGPFLTATLKARATAKAAALKSEPYRERRVA